jgi:hypothetical protein
MSAGMARDSERRNTMESTLNPWIVGNLTTIVCGIFLVFVVAAAVIIRQARIR